MRSASLAQIVAGCRYADAYFGSLVARGALLDDECASTDGSQGHAIGECAAEALGELIVADGDERRQAYASSGTFAMLRRAGRANASNAAAHHGRARAGAPAASALITVHPIKPDRSSETWTSLWSLLDDLATRPAAMPTRIVRVQFGRRVHDTRRRPMVTVREVATT